MSVWDRIRSMLGMDASSPEELERLRAEFSARYHAFKLLLTANNRALEVMADLERALDGDEPFGMGYVRARCTRATTSVFQMVRQLQAIAPGRYDKLGPRFKEIEGRIAPHLSTCEPAGDAPLVLPLSSLTRESTDLAGAKMANLGECASALGLATPGGFVITIAAYRRFMAHDGLRESLDALFVSRQWASDSQLLELGQRLRRRVERAEIPDDLAAAIVGGYRQLEASHGEGVLTVLRSSALFEDAIGMSSAGQYLSEFGVTDANILEAYCRVVASKYRRRAMVYRRLHGVRAADVPMAVGCMPVVDARVGGVAYSRDPLTAEDDAILIHSVWGIPKPVVDGLVDADRFRVERGDPLRIAEQHVAHQPQRFVFDSDAGECRMEPTGDWAAEPTLDHEQVLALARLALDLERHLGRPQDVEWAIDPNGEMVVLQTRSLEELPEPRRRAEPLEGAPTVSLPPGETASPGAAAGPVFGVRNHDDVLAFPDGAVLVVAQALPAWAAVLDRASAVVAEQGGVVGHLANVAREFRVPALFGVTGALDMLAPDQVVTVDADARLVYDGVVEAVVTGRPPVLRPAIRGSRVYRALDDASRHIVPLTLLDPDSPDFRPGKCETLHDVTRFCHEKSVEQMFAFGVEHRFPERSARQLLGDVPMQFWVIDLEDGFDGPVDDPAYVRLDQIASVPMLALWAGMMAVPWEGPPPVDARGFLSVLMESTNDPSLVPSMPSQYTARNYFMISRNFCSLQSRFGYHFAAVEALVSERSSENYVSFTFQGGAANLERRTARARLVAEILEAEDFRVERSRDSTRARFERYARQEMEQRLRVLGYLIIHTRQLDMVAASNEALAEYRARMLADPETIR